MVSANLATSLSQLLMDVVLVDGDLRRPTLSRVFEVENRPGVMELLESGGQVSKFVCGTPVERLYVLPAGKSAINPANLLGTGGFKRIMDEFRAEEDVAVVIDTSPVSACSDALLMATHTDGAIVVVSPDKWQGEAEAHFVQDLEDQGVELLGAVMNNADAKELLPGSGYGQYGQYGQYGKGYGMYGNYGQEHEAKPKKKFSLGSLFGRKKK
jgi:capsular exopolysaccharide synthesis family protein